MSYSIWDKSPELRILPTPFEMAYKLADEHQKRYDKAKTEEEDFNTSLGKVGAISQDYQLRQERLNYYNQKLESFYNNNKGDILKMQPQLEALKREYNQDLNYGQLGAIQKRYDAQQASMKNYQDAVDEYIKSGGEKGMSKEDAEAAFSKESSTQAQLEKSTFGWTGYKSIGARPTIDFNKQALEIAKEITPQKVEEYTGLKNAGGGYYRDEKTGRTFKSYDLIKNLVLSGLMNDPKYSQYRDFRNDIYGRNDELKKALEQNPNGFLKNTPEGIVQVNPEQSIYEHQNAELIHAAENAAMMKQQNDITKDRTYEKNWILENSMNNENSRSLQTYNLPASTNSVPDAPAKVVLSDDGSVMNGDVQEGWFSRGLRGAITTAKSGIEAITGALQMYPNSPFYNPVAAQEKFNKSGVLAATAYAKLPSPQEATDATAKQLREQYPYLANKFPEKHVGNPNVTSDKNYDANAGVLVNFASDAMTQNQTIIGDMLTPENSKVIEGIQKQLFNTNIFNKVSFKLARGKLNTQREASNELGYGDNIPQDALSKAAFNGYGGFLNPGALLAQIPAKDGTPKDIVIQPDKTTQHIYTHSINASKVYQTGKPISGIEYITEGKNQTPYYFEYVSNFDENGNYGVMVNQYDLNKDGKKGNLIGSENAFNVYAQEHSMWLQYNNYNLK